MAASTIGKIFGSSPITPMQEHMAKVQECAETLEQFIQLSLKGDWPEAKKQQQQIAKLERQADRQKKKLRIALPKSLFLPVPRSDLLSLLSAQDQIANQCKDIAGLMTGRKLSFPESLAEQVSEYTQTAVSTSAQACKAIAELDELLETGFKGKEVDFVEELIHELDRLEHENDKLQVKLRAQLFKLEKNLPPIDVMFMYTVIDGIGELANHAQNVGSNLQVIIAR